MSTPNGPRALKPGHESVLPSVLSLVEAGVGVGVALIRHAYAERQPGTPAADSTKQRGKLALGTSSIPIHSVMRLQPCSILLCACLFSAGCSTPPATRTSPRLPSLSSEQSSDIAIHALGLVGTPYRYGGNTLEGGFDCSGLISFVYRTRTGAAPPRTVAELAGFGQSVTVGDIRSGDLVLFGAGRPSHAGIYVGDGRFVHAPSTGGEVRLDRLDGAFWSRQSLGVRRL